MVLHKPYWAVANEWFLAWQEYTNGRGASPGPIDNGRLLRVPEGGGVAVAREELQPQHDFVFVGSQTWMRLARWHGGGPPIMRKAVRLNTGYSVEMWPVEIRYETDGKLLSMVLSQNNKMRMVRHWLATSINCPPHRCDLFLLAQPVLGAVRGRRCLTPAELRQDMAGLNLRGVVDMEVKTRPEMPAFVVRERDAGRERDYYERLMEARHVAHMAPTPPDNPRSSKRLLTSISRLVCCPFRQLEAVDEQCLVCMEAFGLDSVVRQLVCKHVFCDACILQWFGHSSQCPKCRADILQ